MPSSILRIWRKSQTLYLLGLLFVFISCFSWPAYAELPLQIEKPLTEQGKWKLEAGLTYANANRSQMTMKEPLLVETESGQVVSVPTDVHQEQINQNTLIPSIGLHYGLTPKVELYGRTAWSMSYTRLLNEIKNKTVQNHRFDSVWLGVNYHLIDHPEVNVLGFMEGALTEQRKSMVYGKTVVLGTTFYRSMDPLVLSLTTAYQHHFKDDQELSKDHISGVLMLNPQVSFAANDQITLSSGLTWHYLAVDRYSHQLNNASALNTSTAATTTSLNLGLAYLYSPQTTLMLRNHFDVSGRGGAEIGVSVQMRL